MYKNRYVIRKTTIIYKYVIKETIILYTYISCLIPYLHKIETKDNYNKKTIIVSLITYLFSQHCNANARINMIEFMAYVNLD